MAVADLLSATAGRLGGKKALTVTDGTSVSFAELDAEVDRVAAGLVELGVGPGDRVAIGMPNCIEFVVAYFAVLRAGAVVVPLNVLLTAAEIARVIEHSGAKVVLAAGSFVDAVGKSKDVTVVAVGDGWKQLGGRAPKLDPVDISDDDVAVLAYTSGTTGEPKAAVLSHANLLANLDQQMRVPDAQVTEDDVLFLALPLFHIFGLNVALGLVVLNGATGVLVDRFEPVATLSLIREHKVTILFGAPPMYGAWCATPGAEQYDLSSVRLAISGAAPLSPDVLREFRDLFGVEIYEGYGLTETAPTLTSNRMGDRPRPGSIGKPLPDVQLRLVDEEGHDVELGDPGEIVVRGPNVFRGYWNNEEATRAVFRDGWFRTGDVAVQDEDGYLYIVDRKRDLIIVSGFNVFPSEVEAALVSLPKVAEAAVVGGPHPYTGETVKAFVVLQAGETATEEELITAVQERLARFKCPTTIEIVDELPHLLTGKILRRALRT